MYKEGKFTGKVAYEDEVISTVLKNLRIKNTSCNGECGLSS